MRIAPHLVPATQTALDKAMGRYVPYTPVCAWPDDCMVQWGNGLIPANPFFEAFPPGTFIRGDGVTIEDAERKAFAQYQSEFGCDHIWGRRRPGERGSTYLNGAGFCRRCEAFRSRMFAEVVVLGHWRVPLDRWERDHLRSLEDDHEMNAHMDRLYPERSAQRRKSQKVLRLRLNLYGQEERPSETRVLHEGAPVEKKSRDELKASSND